jgi:trk system potassium uptake protein
VSRISSGAYATEDSASDAKTGSAMRFGSSVSPSWVLRSLRPSSNRLPTSERFTTSGHAITALETLPRPDTRLDAVHIVIMGCGRVGSMLARSLEKRGHTVAVIDLEPDSFRRLGPDFSGKTVKGVGFDREVLLEAGITDADGFAAVSSGDNSNILSARVVRETFAVDNVVARIYDPGRAEVYERLGIPTVATVRWTSDQMLRRLLPAGSEPQWRDPSGSVRLMEVHVDRSWVGRTMEQIEAATGARVPFLFRLGAGMVPKSSTVFQDGDLVYAAVADAQLAEVEATLGQPPRGD